jgi:hypothetical protein
MHRRGHRFQARRGTVPGSLNSGSIHR